MRAQNVRRTASIVDARRQRALLVAALVTALVEVARLAGALPGLTVGRIGLSPSLLPALIVGVLLGRRSLGRPGGLGATRPFWAAVAVGGTLGVALTVRAGHASDVAGVLGSAFDEELVYRFAVPAVATAVLLALRLRVRPARVGGFALAGLWFVLLPGHRAQMDDLASTLAFLAFATLAAVVVYRSGSLLAAGATHAVLNLFTLLALGGEVGEAPRGLVVGCLLVLLVAAYGTRQPVAMGDGVVLDLRDGVAPTVTDAAGVVAPLAAPAEPAEEPDRVPAP